MDRTLFLAAALLGGCAHAPYDRGWLARETAHRTGHAIRDAEGARRASSQLAPGVSLQDGLSEDDAAALALWNNPGFQADLTQLGFARGDLADAGLLPNPTLSLLLPLGPRQVEAWLAWPVDVLWQRRRRVAAALLDVERVSRGLVQSGLDVARDARLAQIEVSLSVSRDASRRERPGRRGHGRPHGGAPPRRRRGRQRSRRAQRRGRCRARARRTRRRRGCRRAGAARSDPRGRTAR